MTSKKAHRLSIFLLFFLFSSGSLLAEEHPLWKASYIGGFNEGRAMKEGRDFKKFRLAVQAADQRAEVLFRRCLREGTPAGKIYGAWGLWSIDQAEGRKALLALKNSPNKVRTLEGCLLRTAPVSEIVKRSLHPKDGDRYIRRHMKSSPYHSFAPKR